MTPQTILKEYFGYDRFRDGQEALIRQILSGGDVLGIMPTGAGKSICYQVPAMLLTGITVVVSPLISLMQDQVAALKDAGLPAACLHSNLDQRAYFDTLDAVRRGEIRLLYAAPERLLTDAFLSLTETVAVAMVAVDEAHCLSQWGQDFRPGYLQIAEFLEQL
ncbi:MAG: DEAD/DEAH box helicase, partial [Oscillospiraceae bacterium]|nr:DEAD/DEAH box helicase [Oscillospiraceae bacterium]